MPRKRDPGGPVLTLLPKLLDPHREAPDLRDAVHKLRAKLIEQGDTAALDEPLLALAQRYAAQIEEAAELEADSERLLESAAEAGEYFLGLEVKRLRRRIELAEIVAKIGPHLNRALADLQATPAARAKSSPAKPARPASRLQQLQGGAS